MVKQIILWETIDGLQFKNKKDAKAHEASSLGLTLNEYKQLNELEKQEKIASHNLSYEQNKKTLEDYTNAIQAVINFRENHNLPVDEHL